LDSERPPRGGLSFVLNEQQHLADDRKWPIAACCALVCIFGRVGWTRLSQPIEQELIKMDHFLKKEGIGCAACASGSAVSLCLGHSEDDG
jgi:hypothetical protein